MKKIEFKLLDGTIHLIAEDKAEEFIIKNLGNFEEKEFKPRRARRGKQNKDT